MLFTVNLLAITISGNTHCDMNTDGIEDPGETCSNDAIWVKLQNVVTGKLISTVPDASGTFSFSINKTGDFNLFIDNNGNSKDDIAAPPANMLFVDPDDGIIPLTVSGADITDNTFVMEPDPTCVCGGGDNNLTRAPILIDGIMDDWITVLEDPDNGGCDSATQTDYDINNTNNGVIQSTGRNLVRFNWTGQDDENGYVYGYTQRVGSNTNIEKFIFYKDDDADGMMENGDIALIAAWQGNNGTVKMEICDYVADDPVNGDPMVWQPSDVGTALDYPGGTTVPLEWVGKSDGYTIQGGLTNCRTEAGLLGKGSADGLTMEWQVSWKTVGMTPFQPITYHISTTNAAINSQNPPNQIDDNMGSCPLAGPPVSNLIITKDADTTTPRIGENVTYTVTVTNDGPDATGGVVANDLLPTGMTYISADGTDWTCVNNGQDINCTYGKVLQDQESSSITIVASVDSNTSLWGDTLTNTVCTSSDINQTIECVDENITVYTPVVILDVNKSVNNETPFEDDDIFYTISVKNTGDDTANNIVLNDVLPSGVAYVDSFGDYWVCTEVSNVVDCNFTSVLAKDATTELVITANVIGDYPNNYNNTACVHADENTTDSCDSVSISPVERPAGVILTITKGVLPTAPIVGEEVIYGVIVTNPGTVTATNVEVNDTLPPGVIFDSYSATNGSTYNGSTSWSDFNLAPGAQATLIIYATVNGSVVGIGDTVNNEACANADNNTTVICSDVNFTVRAPDVTMLINKTVDNLQPRIKDQITYTIEVTNNGTDSAHDVNVTDILPSGVTYDSHSLPSEDYDDTISDLWLVGTLSPGASRELNITVQIDDTEEGNDISNVASVISTESPTPVEDDANLTVSTIIIETLKISSNSTPEEGDLLTYTIVVNNTGNAPASNIVVTDTIPDDVTYVNAGDMNWSCVDNGDIECTYLGGELEPGVPISFDINVTVNPGTAGEELTNTACTVVDQLAPNTESCAEDIVRVSDDLDLALSKTVDNSTPSEGDIVVYTISVTNNGPLTATGVQVTEDIVYISGLTIVDINESQGSMPDDETWQVGTLDPGETARLYVTVSVDTGTQGNTYLNNAVLTDLNQTDIESGNNHAQATITVTCPCNEIKSDSASAFGTVSASLMMLMTLMLGLFFVRREIQLNSDKR